MSTKQNVFLRDFTAWSEREQRCFSCTTASQRMKLLRASQKATVTQPAAHLYAPKAYWLNLSFPHRAMHIIRAITHRHPQWIVNYLSAALVWGLTQTVFLHGQVHISSRNHTHIRNTGSIKFHYSPLRTSVTKHGIRVTPLIQTVFDCARRLDYCNALAICDTALRKYQITRKELLQYAQSRPHAWGRARAIYVFLRASKLSESGGESVARALFDGWGFEPPLQQVEIPSPIRSGQCIRVDFLWKPQHRQPIVGELDGQEKYINPAMTHGRTLTETIMQEKDRETEISLLGFTILRFSYQQLQNSKGAIVKNKLRLAGVPKAADSHETQVKTLFSSCWQHSNTCWAGMVPSPNRRPSQPTRGNSRPPTRHDLTTTSPPRGRTSPFHHER